ncbi:hypothetical protein MJO28_016325 [Puccinia striiformis f. sp. tritici]|uniref:Uncharacterized protein n=1 Tax=Puccinia striiformis f. sp. tritici TaxID=168172 RepID=A0ACC0DPH5_9BASI|nr:hypothetical protein MJO28_016325 [Puccinia striiformis f. sp. tritici]
MLLKLLLVIELLHALPIYALPVSGNVRCNHHKIGHPPHGIGRHSHSQNGHCLRKRGFADDASKTTDIRYGFNAARPSILPLPRQDPVMMPPHSPQVEMYPPLGSDCRCNHPPRQNVYPPRAPQPPSHVAASGSHQPPQIITGDHGLGRTTPDQRPPHYLPLEPFTTNEKAHDLALRAIKAKAELTEKMKEKAAELKEDIKTGLSNLHVEEERNKNRPHRHHPNSRRPASRANRRDSDSDSDSESKERRRRNAKYIREQVQNIGTDIATGAYGEQLAEQIAEHGDQPITSESCSPEDVVEFLFRPFVALFKGLTDCGEGCGKCATSCGKCCGKCCSEECCTGCLDDLEKLFN